MIYRARQGRTHGFSNLPQRKIHEPKTTLHSLPGIVLFSATEVGTEAEQED